jgi:hypothetical protein
VHPQPQPIDRVVVLTPSVGLLLVVVTCAFLLTGVPDRAVGQVPVIGVDALTLTETSALSPAVTDPAGIRMTPREPSRPVVHRDPRRPQDQFPVQHAATITPLHVDPSRDRRADLMEMAVAIRWHRGAASDLPPGSD